MTRGTHHREVVGDDRDLATVNLPETGDLAVGGRAVAVLEARARRRKEPRLEQCARIEQPVEPLARVEHVVRPAPRKPLGPAHGERRLAPPIELAREVAMRLFRGRLGCSLRVFGFHRFTID